MKINNKQASKQIDKVIDRTDHSDLQALPDEMKLLIFSHLDPQSSLAAAVASPRAWYPLINDAEIWRQRIVAQFPYLRALKEEAFQSTPKLLYLEERDFIRDYRNKYNDNESLLIEIASGNLDIITSQELNEHDRERLFCFATVYGWHEPHLLKLESKLSALQIAATKGYLKTVKAIGATLEDEKNESFVDFLFAGLAKNSRILARIFPQGEMKTSLCEDLLIAKKAALSHGYTEIAEYLMGHKIVIQKMSGSSLLEHAQFGHCDQIKYKLTSAPSLYDVHAKGEALLVACRGRHFEAAQVLLASLTKDMNEETHDAVNEYRLNALSIAAMGCELCLLQLLYENVEDILTSDLKNQLLVTAKSAGYQNTIAWLEKKLNLSKPCLVM